MLPKLKNKRQGPKNQDDKCRCGNVAQKAGSMENKGFLIFEKSSFGKIGTDVPK